MGQFIQVNGDYNIKTAEGANITLDTGAKVGNVYVTGNLTVEGTTLTVEATNLDVQDNIITVNKGETSPTGITLRYAGIEVDRGPVETRSAFVFDENDNTWNIGYGSGGSYSFVDSNLRVTAILTSVDNGQAGDLTLIGTGTGVVKVAGTTDYEDQVTDDDDIPNKRYVDVAIQTSPTFQIKRDNTRVIAFDSTDPIDPLLFPIGPYISQPAENQAAVIVDDTSVAVFYQNRVTVAGLSIFSELSTPNGTTDASVIQATNTNGNIKLETNGSGKVQISYAMQFDQIGLTPASVTGSSLLYGGSVNAGTTGLYVVNTTKTDELVSKSRALLFSMIF